jgi:hypothetical protein
MFKELMLQNKYPKIILESVLLYLGGFINNMCEYLQNSISSKWVIQIRN